MLQAVGHFLARLFSPENPIWLFYPLCAVVAVIYKATKFDSPKKILLASLHFFASVTLGMFALGLVFYILSALF
jgi:hypothetical protein